MSKQNQIINLTRENERLREDLAKVRDELEAERSWKLDLDLAREKFEKDLRTATDRFIEKLSEIVPQ